MTLNYEPFKAEITQFILNYLNNENLDFGDFDTIYNLISLPPDFALGQAAFPCFALAKMHKKSPLHFAQHISIFINSQQNKIYVNTAQPANAYINFQCNFDTLLNYECERNFEQNSLAPKQLDNIIVEYSQPNTHKILHVGHLRCLVLGDAVCNILEYVGHAVTRATYPGDIGTHVAKVIWYLTHPNHKTLPIHNKAQWLGEMYAQADIALKALKDTPQEPEAKKQIGQILKQISDKHGKYYDLWKETREWSLDYLKSVYEWLDCDFDSWFFESEFDKPSIEFVLQKYKEGFFIKDNGAIGIDLSEHNLGFVMYLKSDGNGLYITKDLLLLFEKFSNQAITKSIYVVDARQKRHFEQLFKTAELMKLTQAAQSFHLSYETVNTEAGEAFSSRSKNGFEIYELKDKMENKILTDYLERYRNQWSDADILSVAQKVCVGALKYGLLKTDNNTQIHFSLGEWLTLDGETGPYLQYVHARCTSILNKIAAPALSTANFVLTEEAEKKLLFFIHRFPEFCLQSAANLKPSTIANYLYDLAKTFNRFYENCPILKSESSVQHTRLALVQLTQKTISTGLKLLGIQSPDKM